MHQTLLAWLVLIIVQKMFLVRGVNQTSQAWCSLFPPTKSGRNICGSLLTHLAFIEMLTCCGNRWSLRSKTSNLPFPPPNTAEGNDIECEGVLRAKYLNSDQLRSLLDRLTDGEDIPVFCSNCGAILHEEVAPILWLPPKGKQPGLLVCYDCWYPWRERWQTSIAS